MFDITKAKKDREIDALYYEKLTHQFPELVKYPGMLFSVYDYAKARAVDPLAGHIAARIVFTSTGPKLDIMTTINGYRHIGHTSGDFRGKDAPVYGPDMQFNYNGISVIAPEWVEVTVYVSDGSSGRYPVTQREYWSECVVLDDIGNPLPHWIARPKGQLSVRAECQAWRAGFSGCDGYSDEEMEYADSIRPTTQNNGSDDVKQNDLTMIIELYGNATTQSEINEITAKTESMTHFNADEWSEVLSAFKQATDRLSA